MPIVFDERWNQVNLSKLKLSPVGPGEDREQGLGNIARFWKAKTRMKIDGNAKIAALNGTIDQLERQRQAALEDPALRFTKKMTKDLTSAQEERDIIGRALARDKVTAPMVKKFAPGLAAGLHQGQPKLLDPVMEQIHNDRLRIADRDMLRRYHGISILSALVAAKPRFTQDAKVAAMFARAIAIDGDPVRITQGVHQADDPHFDLLVPGETQQYHVEVTLGVPLVVRSVSYMLGPQKKDGVRRVGPDGHALSDII
jgi:hypothetical protein